MEELSFGIRTSGEHVVLAVTGEIDVHTAPELRSQLLELVRAGRYDLVIDLSEVGFLDSTGLGVLIGALRRVQAHEGSITLIGARESVLKIFRVTGLTAVFHIHDSLDELIPVGGDSLAAPVQGPPVG